MMQVFVEEYKQSNLRVNCINSGGMWIQMCVSVFLDEDINKLKILVDIMLFYFYLMGDDSCRKIGISFDV